jgi:hypothetical protein
MRRTLNLPNPPIIITKIFETAANSLNFDKSQYSLSALKSGIRHYIARIDKTGPI